MGILLLNNLLNNLTKCKQTKDYCIYAYYLRASMNALFKTHVSCKKSTFFLINNLRDRTIVSCRVPKMPKSEPAYII